MLNSPQSFRLMSGSYPGEWGAFLTAYGRGDPLDLPQVQRLINDVANHRQYETHLPLSPSMANAMELIDLAIGNDDPLLMDAVMACHPDILKERSAEEISPSATVGLCAMSNASNTELPIRATWLELASFRLSVGCLARLLAAGALLAQPVERRGWPSGLAMWSHAESNLWMPSTIMLQALRCLHAHGANFNLTDPWGRLPLCLLSRSGPPSQTMDVCGQLIGMGAHPLGPLDEDGGIRNGRPFRNCPVLENIRQGNMASTSCFLSSHGNEVALAKTDAGNGALHAVAVGCIASSEPVHNVVALTRELVERGCDPNAENDEGLTPVEIAVGQEGLLDFAKELHRHGARLARPPPSWPLLFTACGCPEPSTGKPVARPTTAWVRWLISNGCCPNSRILGRSVVHYIMDRLPRVTMPSPLHGPNPCMVDVLGEVIASGWYPLPSDSGSIEDMIMATNPGPSLDAQSGWPRLEKMSRIVFLVESAIRSGWFDDPLLPSPSPEFASMMGSRWSKHLLERDTETAGSAESDHRRL